jgi:quinol monooxygenase YgiN
LNEAATAGPEQVTLPVDRPAPSANEGLWASDVVAETLRALGIPYAALNPGASFRGLHDSIVNHLGNERPQLILCLHEEHAVAIAHGWAKVRETPMAAIVHSNVGLMHATMAVFNAWCDRVPLLLLGATGPMDAAKRRPWIDWIHTAADQGALVRNFTKWDKQDFAKDLRAVLGGLSSADGCHNVSFYRSLEHPSRFRLLIHWTSVDHHIAFRSTQEVKAIREVFGRYVIERAETEHLFCISALDEDCAST